jgi:hypothetical protein
MRFFFDFSSEKKIMLDYIGSEFKSAHSAVEFAQAKALLLKNSLTRDWVGWSIEVCSPEGAKLCSLPIDDTEMTFGKEPIEAVVACV